MHGSKMIKKVYHAVCWLNGYKISNQWLEGGRGGGVKPIAFSFRIKIICEGKLCGDMTRTGMPNKRVPDVLLFLACRANAWRPMTAAWTPATSSSLHYCFVCAGRSLAAVSKCSMAWGSQPTISAGSVTNLDPSHAVLNCSGTGNSFW